MDTKKRALDYYLRKFSGSETRSTQLEMSAIFTLIQHTEIPQSKKDWYLKLKNRICSEYLHNTFGIGSLAGVREIKFIIFIGVLSVNEAN